MTEELVLSLVSFHAGDDNINKWGLARYIYTNTDKIISSLEDLDWPTYCDWLVKWNDDLSPEERLVHTTRCTNSSKHLKRHFPPRGLNLVPPYHIGVNRTHALLKMIRGIKLTNSETISLHQFILISVSDTELYDAKGIQAIFGQWDVLSKEQKLAFAKEDKKAHVVHV